METQKYEILLAAVIAARATAYIFSKMILTEMGVLNLLALRFLLAGALLALVLHRRLRGVKRRDILAGLAVGGAFFLVMVCELTALQSTPTSTVSLLENCSILFVPLFEAVLLRRLPARRTVLSALTALLGVLCLTLQHGGLSGGMAMGLFTAALYAGAIIVTGRVSKGAENALAIGVVEVVTLGALALVFSLLLETPHLPTLGSHWAMLAVLVVVCTCVGYTLQPVAQSRVSVERAGLLCAISPAIATLLGGAVLHEELGGLSFLGLGLILLSIVFPYLKRPRRVA